MAKGKAPVNKYTIIIIINLLTGVLLQTINL